MTRIASRLDDERHLAHALAILFTVGGVPAVYAGDEQAFRGVKEEREGGDDEIRPAFPDHPDQLAPHGTQVYRLHQQLIGLRRRHPWLVRAHTTVHHLTNTELVYVLADDTTFLAVALNVADHPADLPLPTADWRPTAGDGRLTGGRAALPPTGWIIATSTRS
ncbi:glycosidase [Streptomyces sp. V4I2]|nr:glycosidase [Streptomyces sp. V4I2]